MTFIEAVHRYKIYLILTLLLLSGLYFSIVPDMVRQWYFDDNYSHGFLVPVITGYFIYSRWNDVKDVEVAPSNLGLLIILLGLMQLTLSTLGTEFFTMRSSLIVLLAGVILFLFGKGVMKILAFPIAYLIFMVPIPYIVYDALAFPLKLIVAKYSVVVLRMLSIPVMREGNIIMFPAITLEVADACSGIRSLMSLLALSTAYAMYLAVSSWKKVILILMAVPIAILTNGLRVFVTGLLAQYWGAKAAEGFFHEFAGLAVFALAMVLIFLAGAALRRIDR